MAVVDALMRISLSKVVNSEALLSCSDLRGCCRGLDDLGHFFGVRQKHRVARLDLGRRRADACGVEALQIRMNRLVVERDEVPRRDGPPCCLDDRIAKRFSEDRLLSSSGDASLGRGGVLGEQFMKLCPVDRHVTRLIRPQRGTETRWIFVAECRYWFVC